MATAELTCPVQQQGEICLILVTLSIIRHLMNSHLNFKVNLKEKKIKSYENSTFIHKSQKF